MRQMDPGATLSEALILGDTSVPWGATLVQPERMLKGSRQAIIVDVSGPRLLDGGVRIRLGPDSGAATWEGEAGQRRRCLAPIRPSVGGVHRVLVEVAAGGGEAPLLDAGKIIVASP
jgi:hypothetical protein